MIFSRSFVRKRVISLATTTTVMATSFALAEDPTRPHHSGRLLPVHYITDRSGHSAEQLFLSEDDAAMNRMVVDMSIAPVGDVDRDFVDVTVPQPWTAIDMAKAELRYGQDERIRRLVQQIVMALPREIAPMWPAVGKELPLSAASALESSAPTPSHDSAKMNTKE
jgi:Domain of unknown function (DUF305)